MEEGGDDDGNVMILVIITIMDSHHKVSKMIWGDI